MIQFWKLVVGPLLEALEPRVVVEVGMFKGVTTEKLLDFADGRETVVHGIDPADPPEFDLERFREQYGDRFVFHNAPSLDVLPRIRDADVVLLDGDHNWYTVFNELSALDAVAREEQRPFPLTLLHDIDWPWGRRDMYYVAERIPEDQRNGVTTGGVTLGRSELSERGFARRVPKAPLAGTPRNGVRTAIEDFLAESEGDITFRSVPGFHGCGILVDAPHFERPAFRDTFAAFDSPEFWRAQCERIEEGRLWTLVQLAEARQRDR